MVIVFGNTNDGTGAAIPANGVLEELAIAREHGVYPIPIGLTGHVAHDVSRDVLTKLRFRSSLVAVKTFYIEILAQSHSNDDAMVIAILKLIAPK
jgi:hypothetical protein